MNDGAKKNMRDSGHRAGRVVGSRAVEETLREMLRAAEEGELEHPYAFSGDWTPQRAFEDAGVEMEVSAEFQTSRHRLQPGEDKDAELLDMWITGFRNGYRAQATEDARSLLPGYPPPGEPS